jgi:Zn-dependent protease
LKIKKLERGAVKGSWRMARLAGVDINIHWSCSIIVVWVILQGSLSHGNWGTITYALVAVLALFACVMLHELGHALTALQFKVQVKNIILLPVGGLAQMHALPQNPLHELFISAAGPLMNLAMATVLLPVSWLLTEERWWVSALKAPPLALDAMMQAFFQQGSFSGLMAFFIFSNLILFIFNLIPAFPMDGGRILRALLALFVPYPRATQIAVGISWAIIVLLILTAIKIENPVLVLVAFFIFMAGRPLKEKPVRSQ